MRRPLSALLAVLLALAWVAAAAGPAAAATPPPVLLSDDFQDGDLAGWQAAGGSWSVVDDGTSQLLLRQSSAGRASVRAGSPGWADYSVATRFRVESTSTGWVAGVALRVERDGSHYRFVSRGDQTVALQRVQRGRVITLASAADPSYPGYWRAMRLTAKGDTLIATIASTSLVVTDTRLRAGRVALLSEGTATDFDDVRVESWAGPAPGEADTQAPLTPAAPTVVTEPGFATVTWKPTIDNVGVTEYVIYQANQFYQSPWIVATTSGLGPIRVPIDPTAAVPRIGVAARDAAGNISSPPNFTGFTQPPTFPRQPGDTSAPSAPGNPVARAATETGQWLLTWEPARDDTGVLEYHVYLIVNIDEVRVVAKTSGTSASIPVPAAGPMARVVAFDRSWNSTSSPTVPLRPPTPSPSPPAG